MVQLASPGNVLVPRTPEHTQPHGTQASRPVSSPLFTPGNVLVAATQAEGSQEDMDVSPIEELAKVHLGEGDASMDTA